MAGVSQVSVLISYCIQIKADTCRAWTWRKWSPILDLVSKRPCVCRWTQFLLDWVKSVCRWYPLSHNTMSMELPDLAVYLACNALAMIVIIYYILCTYIVHCILFCLLLVFSSEAEGSANISVSFCFRTPLHRAELCSGFQKPNWC